MKGLMDYIQAIEDENNTGFVICFTASWDQRTPKILMLFEELAREIKHKGIKFYQSDVDSNQDLKM